MLRRTIVVAGFILLSACSLPGSQPKVDKAHCAAVIMQALANTGPTTGSYQCLAPSVQQQVPDYERNDSIFAGPTTITHYTSLGPRDNGYAYRVEYQSGNTNIYVFSVDSQGRVTDLHRSTADSKPNG